MTVTDFSGKKPGYNSNLSLVEERAASVRIDLSKSFKEVSAAANQPSSPGLDVTSKAPSTDPVYPTDLINQKIEQPTVNPVEPINVDEVNTKPADPKDMQAGLDASVKQYEKIDAQVRTQYIEEMENQGYKDVADMLNNMPAPGASSTTTQATKFLSPLSELTELCAALKDRPNNQRILEAFEKTRDAVHKISDEQKKSATKLDGHTAAINWKKFESPQQVINFFARDIKKDPFMQEAAEKQETLTLMADNKREYEDKYLTGRAKTTVAKVEFHKSDEQQLNAMLSGDDGKVQAAKSGRTGDAVQFDSGDVRLTMGMGIDGIEADKKKVTDISASAQFAKNALHTEPKMDQLIPKFDRAPSVAA